MVTEANRARLGTRQVKNTRDKDGEPMADNEEDHTGEMEVLEEQRDVTMAETAGETEMGAAASNYSSNLAQLRQILHADLCRAGDGSGMKSRYHTVAGAAGGKVANQNEPSGVPNETTNASSDPSSHGKWASN